MKRIYILSVLLLLQACATTSNRKSDPKSSTAAKSESGSPLNPGASPALVEAPKKPTETAEDVSIKTIPAFDSAKQPMLAGESARSESVSNDFMNAELAAAIKSGSAVEIRKVCSMILSRNENDVRALNSLAVLYYKEGRFEMSKYLLRKALPYATVASPLYSNLGVVHLAQGDEREATLMFKKALQIDSQDPIANSNLGAIYVSRKDFAKALVVLEIAYNKGQKDMKTANNYATALIAAKENSKANDVLESLMKSGEATKEVKLNYAILLIDRFGKYKEGMTVVSRLKFEAGSDSQGSSGFMATLDRLEKTAQQNQK
ncbi:MAG TPA: hypothetical protein PLU50_05880 [Pseudobdellovibrionaceae bacterium]|nr:hypothetical protein [Pseudobdellovibrionaceae bacterium]